MRSLMGQYDIPSDWVGQNCSGINEDPRLQQNGKKLTFVGLLDLQETLQRGLLRRLSMLLVWMED